MFRDCRKGYGWWSGVGSVEETSLVETEVAVDVEVGNAIFLKALILYKSLWAANSSLLRSVGIL